MYLNDGNTITNTPSSFNPIYNTWPYQPPKNAWYQFREEYRIDQNGNIIKYTVNSPGLLNIPGGQFKATPTRTGSFYVRGISP